MSIDGKIASSTGRQVRISSEEDMKRVYRLRDHVDAVLVGINTVLSDDPKLTVKQKYISEPKQPVRIILDAYCQTPLDALIVNEKARTIIVKDQDVSSSKQYNDNVTVLSVPADKGMVNIIDAVTQLYDHGIKSILVEGGGTVIWNFISQGLFDELFVYIGSMIIGGKQTPTMAMGKGFENEHRFIQLRLIEFQQLGDGILLHYHPNSTQNNP
jgi:2,5-diamino-6-(ribosylamino)-4(3H)-pyrimidinone 5'-phosphate reductase